LSASSATGARTVDPATDTVTGTETAPATAAPASVAPPATARPARDSAADGGPTLSELLDFARSTAADPAVIARLPLHAEERTWIRLEGPGGSEAWAIGWPPGAETGWHDHGGSRGAFVTADGTLTEHSLAAELPTEGWSSLELLPGMDRERSLPAGRGRAFGPRHVHQVVNQSDERHAVSVHVYYPPLPKMRRYSRRGRVLRLELTEVPEQW
jgi:hypothetical protein